jgi:hypothetical protein
MRKTTESKTPKDPLPVLGKRPPHHLPRSLQHNLTAYALAAGTAGVTLLALSPAAEAQIVYTPAHETIDHDHQILIDLNHDGITDFAIREIENRFGTGNSLLAVPSRHGGGVENQLAVGWAGDLRRGKKIGSSAHFGAATALMANYSSFGDYGSGSWLYAVGSTRYLGIRFQINGKTHYGWARMNVKADRPQKDIGGLLTGYAYQTQPNTPILAGATGEKKSPDESPSMTATEAKPTTLGALALGSPALDTSRGKKD